MRSQLSGIRFIIEKLRIWGPKGAVNFCRGKIQARRLASYFLDNAQRHPSSPSSGITIIADLSGQAALSKTMRDLIIMLKRVRIPVQTFDLGTGHSTIPPSELEGLITPRKEFNVLKYDHVIEMFSSPLPKNLPLKRFRLVFWEFDTGLVEFMPSLAEPGKVLVMSDFNAQVLRQLLPPCVDIRKLRYPFLSNIGVIPSQEESRRLYGFASADFIVFFNFDFNSSFSRKNPDGAVRAFAKALKGIPCAKLVFKTKGANQHKVEYARLIELVNKLGITSQFHIFNDFLPQLDLYCLTNACDVYISLHRGEGFGLGIAEAMSLGKAVVVTDYSSTTEFCNPTNSIPIPYAIVPVPSGSIDNPCYTYVKRWAEPNADASASALRILYEQPDLRKRLGQAAKVFIREHFSPENFTRSVMDFLSI